MKAIVPADGTPDEAVPRDEVSIGLQPPKILRGSLPP
jgi:hypothetical protein